MVEPLQGGDKVIFSIPEVCAYLHSRGWHAPNETLYRHIRKQKLKTNRQGGFSLIELEKYARKYLKPLDITNDNSLAMAGLFQKAFEIFVRIKANEIITFVSGDFLKTEALKLFLINEASLFFKLQNTYEQADNNEKA